MNSSNFTRADSDGSEYDEIIRLKQLEIASEWDGMERELQDDEFWYFINVDAHGESDKSDFATRIEFIFKFMRDVESDGRDKEDPYGVFKFFVNKFSKNNAKEVEDNWQEIKQCYYILREWFLDREYYHKIGYLLHVNSSNVKITDLYNERMKEHETKAEFKEWLNKTIHEILSRISEMQLVRQEDIETLDFYNHKQFIKSILLWHNVYTTCNTEEIAFFSFCNYKREKWSIEHIHAQNSEDIKRIAEFKEWVQPILRNQTDKKVRQLITRGLKGEEEISKLTGEIIKEMKAEYESDNIENLALLTSADNSSVNNKLFVGKRQKIIDLEKQGSFIPICTRNVFLKYYTKHPTNFIMWEEDDREAYIEDIYKSVTVYQDKQGGGQ